MDNNQKDSQNTKIRKCQIPLQNCPLCEKISTLPGMRDAIC